MQCNEVPGPDHTYTVGKHRHRSSGLASQSPALELAHWAVENTSLLERARTQSLELRARPQPLNPGP